MHQLKRRMEITPLLLLEFHPETEADTVDWLLQKIRTTESLGGLDLLARVVSRNKAGGAIVAVGATSERLLLEAAEELLFRHRTGSSLGGQLPEVRDPGGVSPEEGVYGILSSAECVTLLERILARLRVGERKQVFQQIHLQSDEPVMSSLSSYGVLTDSYPFHETPLLQSLQGRWRACWWGLKPFSQRKHQQLLGEIRAYFGEAVALYFGSQGSLVSALVLKSIVSIFLYFYSLRLGWGVVFFTLSNFLWSVLFLESWRQTSKHLEGDWGNVVIHLPHGHSSTGSWEAQDSTPPQSEVQMNWRRLQHWFTFLTCNLCLSSTLILTYLHTVGLARDILLRERLSSTCHHILVYMPEIALTVSMAGMDCLAVHMSQSLFPEPEQTHQKWPLLPEVIVCRLFNHFAVHLYRVLVLDDLTRVPFHLTTSLSTYTECWFWMTSPGCPSI
ncbi:hypothetical protein DPEC_G00281290 [Dallia pectoralis]|uniref:Uncharacterized protein n=1 Tax=Dallia pectoralis TaxID=75939 RepID=A0ACC2FMR7_DALPE|nr:hypothetical protein DPEC_G00281290 [Dallia pectoralis]